MNLNQASQRPFTKDNILNLKPNQNGVYGIHNGVKWLYVGKGDIRTRMLEHFNGDIPSLWRNQPSQWCAIVTPNADALEKAEIIRCQPLCNQRVG